MKLVMIAILGLFLVTGCTHGSKKDGCTDCSKGTCSDCKDAGKDHKSGCEDCKK